MIATRTPISIPTQTERPGRRGRARTWLKRRLLGLLALVIAVPLVGAAYQAVATEFDRWSYPAPGQLVDVGGFRLHVQCTGQNIEGSPTVILEGGLGATSSVWAWTQPEIARSTRVCSYDRAGHGWSEPGPAPRDAHHISAELHRLLQNARIPGPYVLVGWSYGGLYIRQYADQYRDEVAGLVLLDSSSAEQCTSTPAGQAQCSSMGTMYSVAPALARLGVMRVMGLRQPATGLPDRQHGEMLAAFSATKDWDAQSGEFKDSPVEDPQAFQLAPLGAMPLFVLTADEHGTDADLEQLWQGWQSGFTALSTNAVQRVVPGATHMSLVFDRTHAAVTTEAVLRLVEAARTGEPLTP